jgi:hypothetical protein
MDVVVIREWLMPSNPERGVQEEVFLLPSEELFSDYVENLTGVKDAVATGERYVTYEDDEVVRGYDARFPPAIQQFRSERVLIKDLKQALLNLMEHIDGNYQDEVCMFCGEDIVDYDTHHACPSEDCIGNAATAVLFRANEYLNGAA